MRSNTILLARIALIGRPFVQWGHKGLQIDGAQLCRMTCGNVAGQVWLMVDHKRQTQLQRLIGRIAGMILLLRGVA